MPSPSSLPNRSRTLVSSTRSGARRANATTSALDVFGTDVTGLAREGRLEPLIGREREVARVIRVLMCLRRNSPLLVGEPGVGKNAIVFGLAKRIVDGDVPEALLDHRIIEA